MSEMRLLVIGESSGRPLAGGATSCYLVEYDGAKILLDIGSGALSVLERAVRFDEIDDIFISHFHSDHVADAGPAVYHRLISTQLGLVTRPLVFHSLEEGQLACAPYSVWRRTGLESGDDAGPFHVSYLAACHPVPALAMKVTAGGRTLVYTGDGSLTGELAGFCSGADILIAECSFYPGRGNAASAGHMNAGDVAALASKARPGLLVVSHLPVYGDRTEILDFIKNRYDSKVMLASTLLEVIV